MPNTRPNLLLLIPDQHRWDFGPWDPQSPLQNAEPGEPGRARGAVRSGDRKQPALRTDAGQPGVRPVIRILRSGRQR